MTAEAQRVARRALLDLIADQLERRRAVPCVTATPTVRGLWTNDDPGTQRVAAAACGPCSVFAACRAYGQAHPLDAGVYGGLGDRERAPRRGRPPSAAEPRAEVAS